MNLAWDRGTGVPDTQSENWLTIFCHFDSSSRVGSWEQSSREETDLRDQDVCWPTWTWVYTWVCLDIGHTGIPPAIVCYFFGGKMMILRMVDVPEYVCMYCTHVDLLSSHLKMMLNLCVQEGCGVWPVTKDYMLLLPAQLRHITTFIYIIYMYHIISIILCWLQKNLHGSQNSVSETNGEQLSWERNHQDGTLSWWVWIIFFDPQNLRCWSILNRKPGKAHHIFGLPKFDSPN